MRMFELLSVIGKIYSSVIRDIARQGKPTSKRASKGDLEAKRPKIVDFHRLSVFANCALTP